MPCHHLTHHYDPVQQHGQHFLFCMVDQTLDTEQKPFFRAEVIEIPTKPLARNQWTRMYRCFDALLLLHRHKTWTHPPRGWLCLINPTSIYVHGLPGVFMSTRHLHRSRVLAWADEESHLGRVFLGGVTLIRKNNVR